MMRAYQQHGVFFFFFSATKRQRRGEGRYRVPCNCLVRIADVRSEYSSKHQINKYEMTYCSLLVCLSSSVIPLNAIDQGFLGEGVKTRIVDAPSKPVDLNPPPQDTALQTNQSEPLNCRTSLALHHHQLPFQPPTSLRTSDLKPQSHSLPTNEREGNKLKCPHPSPPPSSPRNPLSRRPTTASTSRTTLPSTTRVMPSSVSNGFAA